MARSRPRASKHGRPSVVTPMCQSTPPSAASLRTARGAAAPSPIFREYHALHGRLKEAKDAQSCACIVYVTFVLHTWLDP